MNKRANLYFAALLGAMSPLSTVTALAAQSNSAIATATQQQNSCKGTVKDASGEPIIGATIRIDGKTGGTVTDLDGNFVLNNLTKGAKLTITYVGYKAQTITWNGTPLDIRCQRTRGDCSHRLRYCKEGRLGWFCCCDGRQEFQGSACCTC
jgi:hypothetical protein